MVSRSYDQPDVYSNGFVDNTKISGSGSAPADVPFTAVSRIVRGEYRGNVTPNFHKRRNAGGLLPLNGYLKWDYLEDRLMNTYEGTHKGPNPKYSTKSYGPEGAILGSELVSLAAAVSCLNRIVQNVNVVSLQQKAFADISPDLDALTTMAEIGKTVSMILGVRKRALSLILQARKGGFDTARAAAKAWLEWRYGWRILGYDIQNFCDFWERPLRGPILQGFAGTSLSEMETKSSHITNYFCSYDNVSDISRSVNVKVIAAVLYTGRNANVLVSPVGTAWEVIPLSFVADWFVSVGDTLKAWEVIARAEKVVSSVGYRLEENVAMSRQNPVLGSGANAIAPFGTSGSARSTGTLLRRIPLGSPSFTPQLRVELNAGRIADAIALLLGFKKAARF